MDSRAPALLLLLLLALTLSLAATAGADPPERERSALRAFLSGTPHERPLQWNASLPTCYWTGVRCDSPANATVTELHLPGVGLVGAVPTGTLSGLQNLQVLSLRDNRLEHLALSRNQLSGPIPDALLVGLPRLRSLKLDANRLSGGLPAGTGSGARLEAFNVSFNDLQGPIPANLARFPPESFQGNPGLCGKPLVDRPCAVPSTGATKKRKLSGAAVVAIAVGCGAAALLVVVLLLSLVFVGKHAHLRYSFDLEDLLRASAEVLGKGGLGTSYKAVLEDGATVVVKRLRDVAAARREFGACVEAAAGAAEGHRNLVPLRGYYYSKDEKLLVLDYLPGGSLSARLHGERSTAFSDPSTSSELLRG
ncbi:Putative leucine-rich repeat receptor-like protein kinase family protein [Zea mays]|uniref:Putative leucine-rich repeat receptor-like protein kinase family protein n=1 Tax=Zea mays TaxID=4577 RepID=A0A1D6MEC5_MAIZE|nr:Putative leucine-rich repeat receptor-like protein kinase family protein [Zea mays]